MKIRIAIVDDKAVNRNQIREVLQNAEAIEILHVAETGEDFLDFLQAHGEDLDVVLMDLEMPGIGGIETIFRTKTQMPHIKIIVLTVFEQNELIFQAIKAGAHGYLLKEDTSTNLEDAIRTTYELGAVPMSPVVARKVLQFMSSGTDNAEHTLSNPLSSRETDVLKLLISGKNYKKIGETLFISPFTVRRHVNNIYEKLHVKTRTEVVNIALKNKWL